MFSLEQTSYIVSENATSQSDFEVCVVLVNEQGVRPQMEIDVIISATNESIGGIHKCQWLH